MTALRYGELEIVCIIIIIIKSAMSVCLSLHETACIAYIVFEFNFC